MKKRVYIICFFCLVANLVWGGFKRLPYLQLTEDLEHSIGIAWETESQSEGEVKYGVESLDQSVAGEYLGVSPSTNGHRYYVKLTNLLPGKKYQYCVVADGETSETYSFTTSSSAEDFEFSVAFMSDNHTSEEWNTNAWERAHFIPVRDEIVKRKPEIFLNLGDFCRSVGFTAAWVYPFEACAEIMCNSITGIAPGNHDADTEDGSTFNNCVREFYLPSNGPRVVGNPSLKSAIYYFDYGRVRFICVGAGYGGVRKLSWLKEVLEDARRRPKIKNIITFVHVGFYSARDGQPCTGRGAGAVAITNLFDKYEVAIHFNGHDHVLNRTYPIFHSDPESLQGDVMSTDKENYINVRGTIYNTVPSCWYSQGAPAPSPRYYVVGKRANGFTILKVTEGGTKLEVTSYSLTGREVPAPTPVYPLAEPLKVEDHYIIKRDFSVRISTESGEIKKGVFSYPNPINPECYIPVNVKCKIYNILGQLVREIESSRVQGFKDSRVYWDGKDTRGMEVPNGIYFYEIGEKKVRRMVVLK